MKRFMIFLMTVVLLLGAATMATSAAEYENDESVWANLQLNALFITSGTDIYSDLAEDYIEWWWEEDPPVEEVYSQVANINMRGFAMSPNGDYAYLGALNGGSGLRGVVVLNTLTGVATDFYYHRDVYSAEVAEPPHGPFSYAKGIDADTRGYVYVGYAFSNNYNVVNLGIAKQEDDGTLTEVSFTPVWENGTHGDPNGTHVGVNGVDVITIGEKTYCYVVLNYDYDALYCFDVTDPANPVLNEEFGDGGMIVFSDPNCSVLPEGMVFNEGQYLDVDEDGTIWMVTYPSGSTNGIMCISPDGRECTNFIEVNDGDVYCVSVIGDFLLCGAKNSCTVLVLDKESGEQISTITPVEEYGNRCTRIYIRNDVLYVCDAGADSNTYNAIHVAALSDYGMDFIRGVVQKLNGEEETEAPDDPAESSDVPVESTDAPVESNDATIGDPAESNAPPAESSPEESEAESATPGESAGESKADESKPASTDKKDKASGCSSALISGGAVMMLLAAAFVAKKRK